MKYLITIILSLSAMAQTSFICEIDELDAKFTDDSYLLVKTSDKGSILSIMAMPLRTSHYDEMKRLDECKTSEFLDITFCSDSNVHNETEPTYAKFEEGFKTLYWFGNIFSENYKLDYNCTKDY